MDEKYYKRFESFSNSLNALAEAKTRGGFATGSPREVLRKEV